MRERMASCTAAMIVSSDPPLLLRPTSSCCCCQRNQRLVSSSSSSSSSSFSSALRIVASVHADQAAAATRLERLWQEFFSDPSLWWDNRKLDKKTSKYPDFKHKTQRKALWIDHRLLPPWVQARLAAMAQGQQREQSFPSTSQIFGQAVRIEQLWEEFFSDPSQWWNNRFKKENPKYPDFNHKGTNEALWIDSWWTPPWVKGKIVTIAQGGVQPGCSVRPQYRSDTGVDCGAPGWEHNRDVSKLCQEGQLKEALQITELKVQQGIRDSIDTFSCLLQGCIRMKALTEGKQVHILVIKCGFESNIFLGNCLVDMYAKCGSVLDARQVFDKMPKHNIFSWTAIISAYAKHGQGEEALNLFQQMQRAGVAPDKVVFVAVLKACASLAALEQGKQIHAQIIKSGLDWNIFVECCLVDMYGKCGSIEDARQVFDKMPKHNIFSWTAIISAYAKQGLGVEALNLFQQMQRSGVVPDKVVFVTALKACASLAAMEEGKQVHAQIIKSGLELDAFVGGSLVDMYGKCGSIEDARKVFNKMHERNVASWNAMITAYAQQGQGEEAFRLFEQMQREGMKPDNVTFVSILKACANLAALERGKQVHAQFIKSSLELDAFVESSLVDMYGKCGSIEDARQVFNKMRERDVVSWTAMITGYAQQGHGEEAFRLFEQMQREGMKPDNVTFASILKACASLAALERGKQVHAQMIKSGLKLDVFVESSLVDMYGKCGSIEDARQVFNKMRERNVVSWNAMITGYAQHGHGEEAVTLFEQMQREGVKPNMVTFVGVLSACSHAGLVDEGFHLFHSLHQDHGITPTMEHYCCMVDLLGRAGRLHEAEGFICKMPVQPDAVVWRTLLGACRSHGNVELGVQVFERIVKLEPKCAASYVLLSNVFATACRWDEVGKIRKEMNNAGVKKLPGCSWIEVNGKVHEFLAGDTTHPQSNEIQAELKRLIVVMKEEGYVPDLSMVLRDMGDKQKEDALCDHSEKLAISFGLISTPPWTPIRIAKNLRVCADCHNATKIISKIVGREIIARDANRFHHFKDGVCSCGDYW